MTPVLTVTTYGEVRSKILTPLSWNLPHMIMLSFESGVFQDQVKIAKSVPVYESRNKQLIGIYRRISRLSIFSIIFEKNNTYLMDFIESNDLLYRCQFEFKGFTQQLKKGKVVVRVFLDLMKAFDTVEHSNI